MVHEVSECEICGNNYLRTYGNQKYCSKKCVKARRRIYEQTLDRKLVNKRSQSKYFKTKKGKRALNRGIIKYRHTPRGRYTQLFSRVRHREAKANCISAYTKDEWKQKVKDTHGICKECGKPFSRKLYHCLSIEHSYPISVAHKDFLRTGIRRIYTIDDVEAIGLSCNTKNYNKFVKMAEEIKFLNK
jgi:hypothetical protein